MGDKRHCEALTATREPLAGGVVKIELNGLIDEHANLERLLAISGSELVLTLKGVTSINSNGVVKWLTAMNRLKTQGVKIRFEGCSPVLVQQLDLVAGFFASGTLTSVYLSYFCYPCGRNMAILQELPSRREQPVRLVVQTCQSCGGALQMDTLPKELEDLFS